MSALGSVSDYEGNLSCQYGERGLCRDFGLSSSVCGLLLCGVFMLFGLWQFCLLGNRHIYLCYDWTCGPVRLRKGIPACVQP